MEDQKWQVRFAKLTFLIPVFVKLAVFEHFGIPFCYSCFARHILMSGSQWATGITLKQSIFIVRKIMNPACV